MFFSLVYFLLKLHFIKRMQKHLYYQISKNPLSIQFLINYVVTSLQFILRISNVSENPDFFFDNTYTEVKNVSLYIHSKSLIYLVQLLCETDLPQISRESLKMPLVVEKGTQNRK